MVHGVIARSVTTWQSMWCATHLFLWIASVACLTAHLAMTWGRCGVLRACVAGATALAMTWSGGVGEHKKNSIFWVWRFFYVGGGLLREGE